jgi:hypothetical protein
MTSYFESAQFKAKPGKAFLLEQAVEAYEQAGHGGGRTVLEPGK